jgi:hypothetical protein
MANKKGKNRIVLRVRGFMLRVRNEGKYFLF